MGLITLESAVLDTDSMSPLVDELLRGRLEETGCTVDSIG